MIVDFGRLKHAVEKCQYIFDAGHRFKLAFDHCFSFCVCFEGIQDRHMILELLEKHQHNDATRIENISFDGDYYTLTANNRYEKIVEIY